MNGIGRPMNGFWGITFIMSARVMVQLSSTE